MTMAYADPGSGVSGQWTGATLYDPVLLDPEEYEADQRRTHFVATGLKDPVLRDTLAIFHNALIHKLTGLVTRIPSSSERRWITGDVLTTRGFETYGQYELATSYAMMNPGVAFTT